MVFSPFSKNCKGEVGLKEGGFHLEIHPLLKNASGGES
tara:strand:+ start:3448 stop:3561 length:114 start_codon:yes stop_codon:yes gene_type:complete